MQKTITTEKVLKLIEKADLVEIEDGYDNRLATWFTTNGIEDDPNPPLIANADNTVSLDDIQKPTEEEDGTIVIADGRKLRFYTRLRA